MRPVDAHVHLPTYNDPLGAVSGPLADGTFLLSCTVRPSEAEANLELRRRHPASIACFIGVHPSEVTETLPSADLSGAMEKADGIGEIGLDEKYSPVTKDSLQMRAFLDQLAVAERLGKPVEVHSRGSGQLCLDILSSFRPRAVLMHWFEDEALAGRVESSGYYISVGPALLYSKKIRRIASGFSRDLLMTESDGPVAYAGIGGASGPGLIPSVLFALSELRHASFEETGGTVQRNCERFLERSLGDAWKQEA